MADEDFEGHNIQALSQAARGFSGFGHLTDRKRGVFPKPLASMTKIRPYWFLLPNNFLLPLSSSSVWL
jgi:hypothetical protein